MYPRGALVWSLKRKSQRLREVQKLAKSHPAVMCKMEESRDLVCTAALWLPLHHTASRKRVHMKTSLASEFYKTDGWWASYCLDACPVG